MEKQVGSGKTHVLVMSYPIQGHINPSLAFAKFLASKGLQITFITSTSVTKSAKFSMCSSIAFETISDGSEDAKEPETTKGRFERFKAVVSQNLARFIDRQQKSDYPAKLIVYDSTIPWVVDIAKERGLLGALFFTQSCAVAAVSYHLKQGSLTFPYKDSNVSLPSLPTLETKHLPSYFYTSDITKAIVKILADQCTNVEKADWIFLNTFDKLENEIVDWMTSRLPIKTVGPTFLLLPEDKNHMINLSEPSNKACREWLDARETGSVVYVSFGSIAFLGKDEMKELAHGLIMSNCYFLWVVRYTEVDKLPQNFTSLASGKGLIVDWCDQPQVLAHRALACFMTHCGWNSTLEALSNGMPLIAMAQWADQKTNSKFIEDVWRVGVRTCENGIIGREEIAMCVKEVVEGDKGIELKKNAFKWKKLANEAVEKGGTSANNIEDFITKLMRN